MIQIDPYLFFDNGRCAEAMRFYAEALGGKLEMLMTYGESPEPQRQAGSEHLVMHASIAFGERRIMASDFPADHGPRPMQGFDISLGYATPEEARRVFDRLAEGGTVKMPFGPTFWSKGFGGLVDRFGTPWMVSGGQPDGA